MLSGGFNVGDTNHDNQLSAGETWQYTASHTVTQNDINTLGGGDGFIENTVTADSAQTTPVSATASVVVESGSSVDLTKTANVASVHAAGDVISYTITVANNGNTTLTNPVVEDNQVNIVTPIPDFNAPVLGLRCSGSSSGRRLQQSATPIRTGFKTRAKRSTSSIAGDENNNGVQDPGETFVFTATSETPIRMVHRTRARCSSTTTPATPTITACRTRARRSSSMSTMRRRRSTPITTP